MKYLLLFLGLFFTLSSLAQNGWKPGIIELNNGETLKGQVKLPNLNGKVSYRIDKNGKKKKFGHKELSKVYIGAYKTKLGYYEYISTSGLSKSVFKLVINGKVKLYIRTVKAAVSNMNNIPPLNNISNTEFTNVKEYYLMKDVDKVARPVYFPSEYNWHNKSEVKRFKKEMSTYFSDCKDILSFIENDLYEDYNIRLLVEDYNTICE